MMTTLTVMSLHVVMIGWNDGCVKGMWGEEGGEGWDEEGGMEGWGAAGA